MSFSSERPNDQARQAKGVKRVELSQQRLGEEPTGSTGMCTFPPVVLSCLEAGALGGPSKPIRGTLESFHPIIGNKLAPLIEGFPEITSERSSISTQKR